jgi:sugar phosphate isomerase/epimerase
MRVAGGPVHLTYCTNIHAAESWTEVNAAVRAHLPEVKARVSPHAPMGVGLRLSHEAARELEQPEHMEAFKDFLHREGLYVFTINGFPYGPFAGQPVKEAVYRPDWMEEERLVYTDRLARILAALWPAREPPESAQPMEGSISTVPGCYRARGACEGNALAIMAARIARHAVTLFRMRERGGPIIGLGLEPEPDCAMETTAEAIAFLETFVHDGPGLQAFRAETGLSADAAVRALQRHVGLCLDACHAAVEFEDPAEVVARLRRTRVRVLKIQVTTGLRLQAPDPERLAALDAFAEGIYLHQTVARRGRALVRHADLPQALEASRAGDPGSEWRVHFHVPVFQMDLGGLGAGQSITGFTNTADFLEALLAEQARQPLTHHLEVETYTWDVLPPALRSENVDDAIAREMTWTLERLTEQGG